MIKDLPDVQADRDKTVDRNRPRDIDSEDASNNQSDHQPTQRRTSTEPQEPESARASRERREKAKAGNQQQPQQQAKPSRVAKKPRGNVPPRRTSRRRDQGEQEKQAA